MFFHNISYITTLIAGLAGLAVGFVWYAPWAFGKLWMKSKGLTPELIHTRDAEKSMILVWSSMTLSTLVTAFILAALFNSLIVTTVGGIFLVALCVWIGFVVPVKLGDYHFGGDTFVSFLISVGQQLAAIIVMSLVIGIWG